MRIPHESTGIVSSLGLKSFIGNKKKFSCTPYFEWIDDSIERLKKISQDGESTDRNIAASMIGMLDEEGVLLGHVDNKKTIPYGKSEEWIAICLAAGYVILQMYYKAMEEGEWPA